MKKVIEILEYALAIFIILECRSVYNHCYNSDYKINEIFLCILIVLIIIKMLSNRYDKNKLSKSLVYMCLYLLFISFFLIFNNTVGSTKGFIFKFIISYPLLFLYYYLDKNTNKLILNLLVKISNIMVGLSIISLILYFMGPILNIIKPTGYFNTTWTGDGKPITIPSYFGLQFITQKITIFGMHIARNTGIFTEAPMCSLNLVIAMAVQLFLVKDKSKIKQIILVIAIITTTSSTGIIVLTGMISANIIFYNAKNKTYQTLKYIIVPFLFVVAFTIISFAFNERIETASGDTRKDDYVACYKAWKENIFLGNGYGNNIAINKYKSSFRANNLGNSNSIMVLLAQCGLYLLIFYMLPSYKMAKYSFKTKNYKIIFFIITLLVLFVVAIFTYTYMIINLLAIGYAFDISRLKDTKKEFFKRENMTE